MENEGSGWNAERLVAVARLACQLVATAAAGFGLAVDTESISTIVLCALATAAGLWSWWRNNNMTAAAQEAQKVLDGIKEGDAE